VGVKVDIQAKLIALFKVNEYEVVSYNGDTGIPSVTGEKETPKVQCNETNAIMETDPASKTQVLSGWVFDVILDFEEEVDYSDYIMSLDNLSYAYSNTISVQVTIASNILVTHPVTQGGHHGTQLRFNINVSIKK
jgi:hypothetical protein